MAGRRSLYRAHSVSLSQVFEERVEHGDEEVGGIRVPCSPNGCLFGRKLCPDLRLEAL